MKWFAMCFLMLLVACQGTDDSTISASEIVADVAEDKQLVCFVDQLNAQAMNDEKNISHSEVANFQGWLGFLSDQGFSPAQFHLVLTSDSKNFTFPAATGKLRSDVAEAQAKSGLATSGYEVPLSLKSITPGRYEITMQADHSDGSRYLCGTGKFINVL